MRKLAILTTLALLWGTASFARDYGDVIETAFSDAGYTEVHATKSHGKWLVSALLEGETVTFIIDPATGRSIRTSAGGIGHDAGDDNGVDGAGHDAGDDNGVDGAGHDVGDDNGVDGAGHDVGDDNGVDGAGHDAGDDNGVDGAGHDAGDDNGHDATGHDAGDDHGKGAAGHGRGRHGGGND